jgi:hypothetical protein
VSSSLAEKFWPPQPKPKSNAEVERILLELRAALEEHIRLAKDSLELQASTIALLDELASKHPQKAKMAAD